jgi:hypothetical protein
LHNFVHNFFEAKKSIRFVLSPQLPPLYFGSMFQNGIIGVRGLHRGLPYLGGFCQWWFIPAADVATWYPVSLITQKMETEPLLKAGKNWMGPIRVPDKKLGWEESQERSKAGIFYRHKVSGFHPGEPAG